jgi:hypothetical protein
VPTQNHPKLKNWQNVGTARANVGTARAKLLHHIPSKKFFSFPIHSLLSKNSINPQPPNLHNSTKSNKFLTKLSQFIIPNLTTNQNQPSSNQTPNSYTIKP